MGRLRKMQRGKKRAARGLGAPKVGPGNWPEIVGRRSVARSLTTFGRKELEAEFGKMLAHDYGSDADEALDTLWEIIRFESREDDVLEAADAILNAHGVESLRDPLDASEVIASYVNMGDTYITTLLVDGRDNIQLVDWGTFYENWENENIMRCPVDGCDSQFGTDDNGGLDDHLREEHPSEIWVIAKEALGTDGPQFLDDVTWINEADQASVFAEDDRTPRFLKGDGARWLEYQEALDAQRTFEEEFSYTTEAREWWDKILDEKKVVEDPTGKAAPAAPAAAPAPAATVRADRCPHCKAKIRPFDRNCYGCGKKV